MTILDDLGAAVEGFPASYASKIQGEAAGFLDRLSDLSSYPFFVTPAHRLHWFYLFAFLVIALLVYRRQKPAAGDFTLKDFFRFWLPKSVYLHRSSLLDLKFYVVNGMFVEVAFVAALIGSFVVFAGTFEAVLQALWGAPGPELQATLSVRIAYVVAVVLAADLGFFLGHTIGHKVPLLWEFHKVHHSAEVLNPLTNYRFHPIDRIVIGFAIGVVTGFVKGAFGFAFAGGISQITAVNVAILLLFNLTANLRHSHVWLSYGWHASHVFCSPAQHQIHHGSDARHIDKNFGLMFSLWDWLAGTLYVPRAKEDIKLGLTNREHEQYDTLWRLYTLPFVKAGSLLAGRGAPERMEPPPRATDEPDESASETTA